MEKCWNCKQVRKNTAGEKWMKTRAAVSVTTTGMYLHRVGESVEDSCFIPSSRCWRSCSWKLCIVFMCSYLHWESVWVCFDVSPQTHTNNVCLLQYLHLIPWIKPLDDICSLKFLISFLYFLASLFLPFVHMNYICHKEDGGIASSDPKSPVWLRLFCALMVHLCLISPVYSCCWHHWPMFPGPHPDMPSALP